MKGGNEGQNGKEYQNIFYNIYILTYTYCLNIKNIVRNKFWGNAEMVQ